MDYNEFIESRINSNPRADRGDMLLTRGKTEIFRTNSVQFHALTTDFLFYGHNDKEKSTHVFLSAPIEHVDGTYTSYYDASHPNNFSWSIQTADDDHLVKVKTGTVTFTLSENRHHVEGGYTITLPDNTELSGKFDITQVSQN